jgi:hypothetical protein
VKMMAAVPLNNAVQRFYDYGDNPMVQALTRFITLNLERPLESVANWGVEVSEKSSRKFYLDFTDGTKISGWVEQVWQVAVFEYTKEKTPIVP